MENLAQNTGDLQNVQMTCTKNLSKLPLNDKSQLLAKQICQHTKQQQQNELSNTVRLTSFQTPQLQSVLIFFQFSHPGLL